MYRSSSGVTILVTGLLFAFYALFSYVAWCKLKPYKSYLNPYFKIYDHEIMENTQNTKKRQKLKNLLERTKPKNKDKKSSVYGKKNEKSKTKSKSSSKASPKRTSSKKSTSKKAKEQRQERTRMVNGKRGGTSIASRKKNGIKRKDTS